MTGAPFSGADRSVSVDLVGMKSQISMIAAQRARQNVARDERRCGDRVLEVGDSGPARNARA
jgi:hypothetical protein